MFVYTSAKKTASSATDPVDFRSLLKHREHEKNKKQESGVDWGDLRHGLLALLK
jgi:hypothetical protein